MASNNKTRLCTLDGCDKPHRARGLCNTHYGQRHQPNRHRKVTATCGWCGTEVIKDAGSVAKYAAVYCSLGHRDHARTGIGETCVLPAHHWARWYGKTSTWRAPHEPLVRNTGICAWCEMPNHRGLTSAYCTDECKAKAKRVRRITRLHDTIGTYTYAQLVRLWQSFDMRCAYCRNRTLLADIQAEHVTPLSRGGENHVGNLLPSCMPCNADKRDLTLDEWAYDRARRNLPPVVTHWSADDLRYRHLALSLAA